MNSATSTKLLSLLFACSLLTACSRSPGPEVAADLGTPDQASSEPVASAAVAPAPDISQENSMLKAAVKQIGEFKTPGLECELSGIYPHPENPNWYFVVANKKPPYRYGQQPKLPEKYRGQLLTVDQDANILEAVPVADDDFGGLAFADDHLFVALTNDASILKIDLQTGETVSRFPLASPAGGLAYDADRKVLIAQLYVGHPHLAVVDPQTGEVSETLWSDESAMGLAKVDGDWLCTWASGWDPGSFSELRVLDQSSGKVRSRINFDRIHSCLAPTTGSGGEPAFICLVTVDSESGETVIRKYQYTGERNWSKT